MILASYALGFISWQDGKHEWWSDADMPAEEARIAELFSKPAPGREADAHDGLIEEIPVEIPPGVASHARAVIFGLPHAVMLIDDELDAP